MGTQKNIAAQIQQAQADYILCLKANHPTLFQQIETWFQTAQTSSTLPMPSAHTTEAGHHRTEVRKVWTFSLDQLRPLRGLPPLPPSEAWMGLQTIVIVERARHLWNQTTHEIQFYLSRQTAEIELNCPCHPRLSGGLKIRCTGRSMSPLLKMLVACVLCMPLTTLLWSVALPSIP